MTESGKKRTAKRGAVSRGTVFLIAALVLCAAAVIIGINVMFQRTIDKQDPNRIISGVKIGNTDVSGLTSDQARQQVEKAIAQYKTTVIVLSLGEGQEAEATLEELGVHSPDMEEALEKALAYGKEGSRSSRYKILKRAERGENDKTFSITYQVEEESAERVLHERVGTYLPQPENARLSQSGGETVVTADVPGRQVDLDKTVASIHAEIEKGNASGGTVVTVDTTEAEAAVRAEDLEGITDILGTYTTSYGAGDSGRTMNVESGAAHIDGTFMQPGEEISADMLMAPYTEENGYAMAASYENRKVVESMGGGICQVSTTLYNALLLAELEITERYAHSMLVSYVDPAMDAAIADDVKDLKFRNNMQTGVYIEAVCDGENLTFRIYGKETRPAGRIIEYISEELGTVESDETLFVATEEAIGTLYTQNNGKTGLEAQLWKVVYENGKEVSREKVNYSYYMASGKTVAVGTFTDDPEASAKINEAIESQDEQKINAVIEEVRNRSQSEETDGNGDQQ